MARPKKATKMAETESQAKESQEVLKDVPEEEEPASQESQGSETTKEIVDKVANLEVEESPKRGRGRPKKRAHPSGGDSPAKMKKSSSLSELPDMPKKRGRPKGRRSLLETVSRQESFAKPFTREQWPENGVLLAFGMGDAGQLGCGEDIMERKKPALVKELDEPILCAAAGGMHNVCIGDSGDVYTFGCNDEGALGRETKEEEEAFLPAKVAGVTDAIFCCAGDSHSAVLTNDGAVWIWGTFRDANGRMGATAGNTDDKEMSKAIIKEPAKLEISKKVVRIASGADHLILLDTEGNVWSMGCAESGQLGRISSHFCTKGGRRGLGKILKAEMIHLQKKYKRVYGEVEDIACGQFSSFLIMSSGAVLGFGLNNCYQIGFGDREIRFSPEVVPYKFEGNAVEVKQISSGMHHSVLLSKEGDVFTIGCGDYGRLGVGEKETLRESSVLRKVAIEKKIVSVGTGSCCSYALAEDGSAFAWGMGSNLQLTNGSEDDEWEPVQVAGKQIEGQKVVAISGGGQHAIIVIDKK
ncbi:Oidioi.mRNA.OKI2018_I69.chr2.g5881.t1.cds [Oikopleura dioica]|uniref:Oidioi.mRNA.OKI2018_I69.chr2.g5881.t1.cds n=1 Tax=Oikopleura dioica TaxID=34765 RepID=A0ABN7T170_OIKDI|nr:Oidioi.mRNA.OKI2018_I69.chr2.g5881.t1.cds [Oikopleura dioica]